MLYSEYLKNKRPYQEEGHLFLIQRKHACLFYEPGKGKTYPCIDALRDIDEKYDHKAKVLILSTADAVKNMWNAEIVPQNILPKDTIIMSFTAAIQDKTKLKLKQIPWNVLIIDESHKIKAHNSQISKLVYMLSRKTSYCWGLSGTPRGNNDLDLFCQLHNMNIGEWGDISYSRFIDLCCDTEPQYFGGRQILKVKGITKRYRAGWEAQLARYTQRITYEDIDDMPDLNINTVNIPYEQTKEYKAAKQGLITIPAHETTITKLAAITKLHQICNGYMYLRDEFESETPTTIQISHNMKLDWLSEHVGQDDRVLIVYRFIEDLNKLKSLFSDKWTEDIQEFASGSKNILLLQCSRCESFNLQSCNHIIFYTLDYSYIKYKQMLHRAWRMGQQFDVQVDVLVFDNSIEKDIWKAVQNKSTLAELFMACKYALY